MGWGGVGCEKHPPVPLWLKCMHYRRQGVGDGGCWSIKDVSELQLSVFACQND